MARATAPVFLARVSYRRRRLADAARMVPVLGSILFVLPLLWPEGEAGTAAGLIYIFAVWALLIAIARLLAPWLGRSGAAAEELGEGRGEGRAEEGR
ncbi:hypothetical protein [Pseudoroseicyclus tamaricis]|uniref:Uncharacterized protein n=1 Tax=Pseudoroseicyclus tamaricis TaxID=2705421 RepID=A0A6B2JHV8_9RHOB|nr:hypothetical protein [Pseudoroseicyclus tamaricis]NDV00921.1 hypothetical protein [Pseudoroseicyclus tamaricis]